MAVPEPSVERIEAPHSTPVDEGPVFVPTMAPSATPTAEARPTGAEAVGSSDGRLLPSAARLVGRVAVLALLCGLAYWAYAIGVALWRKQRYGVEPALEDKPTIDERLQGELTTLEVALLRGNIEAFYEKMHALVRQLLRSRHLLGDAQKSTRDIVAHLKRLDVDPLFLDSVESILKRCDAVTEASENPSQAAHAKIAKDLQTLIRMRPRAGAKKPEA